MKENKSNVDLDNLLEQSDKDELCERLLQFTSQPISYNSFPVSNTNNPPTWTSSPPRGNINTSSPPLPSVPMAPVSSNFVSPTEGCDYSPMSFRHTLRLTGIDCFVSGLNVFKSAQAERDSLLISLLEQTPVPSVEQLWIDYSAEYSPALFGLLDPKSFNKKSASGARLYLLQEVCLVTAKTLVR
jgi:hypothetical protein